MERPDPAVLARQAVASGGLGTAEGRQDVAVFALAYAADRFARMSDEVKGEMRAVLAAARLYAMATESDAGDLFLRPFFAGLPDGLLPGVLLAEMRRLGASLATN